MIVTIKRLTNWDLVVKSAYRTVNKEPAPGMAFPKDSWKFRMLRAEHSPLRCLLFYITLEDIPYFVMSHLVRHHEGVTPFVGTSREDRTGIPRSERKQDDLVNLDLLINAQAILNISYQRLCSKADPETIHLWKMVKEEMDKVDPILAQMMVPKCIHQGYCPERSSCGYINLPKAQDELSRYRWIS